MATTTDRPQTKSFNFLATSNFKIAGKIFSFTGEEKICAILLGLLILLIYSIRSKFALIPFERDEGAYAYYGKLLIEGKIPYKDFYEQKFPGIFYFFALIELIFGTSVKQLHTGFTFLNILNVIILYLATKKIFNPTAGIITAITFGIVSLTPNISGFTIQSEHGVAFIGSLGILFYALAKQTNKKYYYLLMGLAMGAAIMTKTTGVFFAMWGALIILIDAIFTKEKNIKLFFIQSSLYALGGIGIIAILFFIIYSKGAFNEMKFWTIELPNYYVNRMPLEEGLKYFGYTKDAIFKFNKFFWVHGLIAIVIILIKSISWRIKLFTITLAACSFLTIVPGYYFYGHYWIQLLPGLSILAGISCYGILLLISKFIKTSKLNWVYLAIFCFMVFTHVTKFKSYYFHPNYEQILRTTYGGNPFPETMEIANFLNTVTSKNDEIGIIGSEPQLYIYTQTKSPTRHIFFSTIVADLPQHKQWQREYVSDIEKHKPKYMVYYNVPISLLVQANTDKYVFEWANKYITQNYKVIGIVEMPDGQPSNYLWKEAAMNYQPKTQNHILVFERVTS